MALIREITIPDEVLDLARGRLIRPDQVARVKDLLDHGGTWKPEAVAACMVDEMLAGRTS